MARKLEQYEPLLREAGELRTGLPVVFESTLAVTGAQTFTGAIAANGGITVPTSKTVAVTDSAGITVNSKIIPELLFVSSQQLAAATFAASTSYPIFTFPNDGHTYKCVFASLRATTAGGAGSTLQVFLDPSGTAPGGGTAQFDAMALDGTANTVVNGANPVGTTSAAGASLSIKAGASATTGLVGMVVSVALQRLS